MEQLIHYFETIPSLHRSGILVGGLTFFAAGFANYEQPVFVEERKQIDFSYQYRYSDRTTFFLDAQNITDEQTRLFVRYPEMLFLAQDHGPVFKLGVRANF